MSTVNHGNNVGHGNSMDNVTPRPNKISKMSNKSSSESNGRRSSSSNNSVGSDESESMMHRRTKRKKLDENSQEEEHDAALSQQSVQHLRIELTEENSSELDPESPDFEAVALAAEAAEAKAAGAVEVERGDLLF